MRAADTPEPGTPTSGERLKQFEAALAKATSWDLPFSSGPKAEYVAYDANNRPLVEAIFTRNELDAIAPDLDSVVAGYVWQYGLMPSDMLVYAINAVNTPKLQIPLTYLESSFIPSSTTQCHQAELMTGFELPPGATNPIVDYLLLNPAATNGVTVRWQQLTVPVSWMDEQFPNWHKRYTTGIVLGLSKAELLTTLFYPDQAPVLSGDFPGDVALPDAQLNA